MFKRYVYHNYRLFSAMKFRFGRRLTTAGWLVLFAFFFTGALGIDTNLSLTYQTFAFIFCLWFAAALSIQLNRGTFSAERILPRFGSVGEKLSYRVLLENKTSRPQRDLRIAEELPDPRPSFLEFLETPEPGEEKRNWIDRRYGYYRWRWLVAKNVRAAIAENEIPTLAPKSKTEVQVELTPLKRGILPLNGLAIAAPEPFGLFRSLNKIPSPGSILILPKRYPVRPIHLPGKMKYQQNGVSFASAVGESEEFVALRDYRPGDPLRHIHWKSFAKLGKPIVKEFQDEFFVRHALILDTFGVQLHSERFEEAVSVASSFAYTLQTQDSLLDLMFVGPQAYCFTAGRGLGQTEQMLEILASVQPCRHQPFSALKQLVLEHTNAVSGCICIFLSWDEERRNFVKQLKAQGLPILVFVLAENDNTMDSGPMADTPENFHVIQPGKVGEELAKL
jgi:uncharacterized protein (DUF58 family)